ncbi:MAG TPA: copper resistance protein B [Steroidobacter sp.]|uniref:copper resistance protein B n=1 Tax=Steroidobacter sp. TaxID=1978227 RepID=UPI002EDA1A33
MSSLIKFHLALTLCLAATAAAAQEEHQHHEHTQHDSSQSQQAEHHDHASHGDQRTESERAHVPPPPPQYVMRDMSEEQMAEMMAMDDTALFGMAMLDQFEWRDTDAGDTLGWDGRLWYGNDYDKALLRTEGERTDGEYEGSAELLWDHVISRWWSVQAGVAHDFGEGPSRTWAAFGVQGLAPYWFEVEATVYAGEEGRTAASLEAEYEMFLTQRLVLQPKLELDLYGKDDVANGIGSGFSHAELGLRLRYEIRREFAPYIGVSWSRKFGETADLAREHGDDADEVQFVAGVRAWF